jgi:glycosyltransferase involved in cell wall biosynthesis
MSIKVALELQPCCGKKSGIGTYTAELAKRLYTDDRISFSGNLFNFRMRNDNEAALRGIRFPIHYNTSMPYGVYRRIWGYLPIGYSDMFPHDADITHFFNYIVPPRVQGKVITTIYDLVYIRYPETMDKKNLARIKKGLLGSIERSDAIVTDSMFIKEEIISQFGLDADTVHVIYPAAAVDEINIKTSRTDLTDKWKIQKSYILFVGNIEPRKNLVRLIKAYNILRKEWPGPLQLVITGGKGWNSDEIYKAAAESAYSADIIFTDYVTADEKAALYHNAELFVYPSIYEGFGIPLLEAMSCSVPVVCSNVSSIPEVVGEDAFLVNPFDEADMADTLLKALTNKELASSKAASAKLRAAAFSWDNSAEKLKELYIRMG